MNKSISNTILSVLAFCALCTGIVSAADKNGKLNFVFFIVDDLGWKDLSCMGSSFYETPAIDCLASDGVLFTDAYQAAPRCVASRMSIMSGKYHYRPELKEGHGLSLKEVTIAEALKEAGYRTFFAGKWHLGEKGHWPQDQGFDVNKGGCEYGSPPTYYSPYSKGDKRTPPGLEGGQQGEYLTDRLTDEAIGFLNEHVASNPEQPFLLYMSHYGVHTPFEAKEKLVNKYKFKLAKIPKREDFGFITDYTGRVKTRQDHAVYAAMIESVDDSIKRIRAALDKLGLSQNTTIIFTSDNGGLSTTAATSNRKLATSNLPLRTGKGWIYEGGIRLPLLVLWPGVTKPGTVCASPVVGTDFYPTMLEMAGLELKPQQHLDGISFVPALKEDSSFRRKPIYWYYTFAKEGTGNPSMAAIRDGNLKLVELLYENRVELYNLKEDIGEQKDIAKKFPEKTMAMTEMLHQWIKETHAWPMNKKLTETNKLLLEQIQKAPVRKAGHSNAASKNETGFVN